MKYKVHLNWTIITIKDSSIDELNGMITFRSKSKPCLITHMFNKDHIAYIELIEKEK